MSVVGKSIPRLDGLAKVTGTARYVDDLRLPGCLFGVTLRSSIAYGSIKGVSFDPSFPWRECVVVTAKDVPGRNRVQLLEDDQPLLAETRVMHPAEPIALIAHPDRAKAYEALRHVRVDYEELDPVLTIEDSLAKKQLLRGEDNVFRTFLLEKGDIGAGFREAAHVVEGEYRVPHQEHAYIETNGVAAWLEKDGTLVLTGSLQCPYYVLKALKPVLDLPAERIRVIQAVTGGAFGGKEEFPNMLCGHAALLALKARRPVKIIYDRAEDMACSTKRHPAVVRHKTGLDRDGRLLAQEIDVVMDGGAYITLSPVVLSRGLLHSTGTYECPNVRARARAVATNTPPNGAFRGFGAPQTLFAAELHMERIAKALGIPSLDLRRRNILRIGSVMATGQVLKESVGASDALETTVRRSGYLRKRRAYDRWNKDPKKPCWRGIGLALVHHGAGFTGSGEVNIASKAAVSRAPGGRFLVRVSNTEMGQGPSTTLAQIAADALGVPLERVSVATPDTHKVPDTGPTVASRTCQIAGGLVRRAALRLKEHPKEKECVVQYEAPGAIHWDDTLYRGEAYGAYGFACAVVDLEVDRLTCEVKVRKVTTCHEVGKAIHPLIVEGQVMGGVLQGLGYALIEDAVFRKGVMQNAQFTNYAIPTAVDAPEIDVKILEHPYSHGPFGAKGFGELPTDVPAPAVAAALLHATGRSFCELPILPERIAKSLS